MLTTSSLEIVHLLGFSKNLFSEYKNSDGNSYPEGTLSFQEVIRGTTRTRRVWRNRDCGATLG